MENKESEKVHTGVFMDGEFLGIGARFSVRIRMRQKARLDEYHVQVDACILLLGLAESRSEGRR